MDELSQATSKVISLKTKVIAWLVGLPTLALIVIGAFSLAGISLTFHPKEKVGESVLAAPASEVKREPKVDVPVSKVRAYANQPKVKAKLNLPAAVIAAKDEQVISSARVDATLRPHTVTTTINTTTGEPEMYVRADPYPWVALESRGEAGLSVGYKYRYRYAASALASPVAMVGRFDVRHDFLQLKALHVGIAGSVDTDGDAYAGVRLSYKW